MTEESLDHQVGEPDSEIEHGPFRPGVGSDAAVPWLSVTVGDPGPDVRVLRVAGEIDMVTSPALRQAIDGVLDARSAVLVVDLDAVTFLGAHGLAALVNARSRCEDLGGRLRLVATTSPVRRILEVTGLTAVLDCHRTLAEAVDDHR